MKNKLILTSFIAIGFACPVMANPTNTGTFPSSGLMQEDYTYTNAATSENMDGVYEGLVMAQAEYANSTYNLSAGYYLPAGGSEPAQCPHGYYCPGANDVEYNENTNQGLVSCSVETNDLYTLSEPGATAVSDCYRKCLSADIFNGLHVTAVSGNVYYGGNQTCAATGCENGYHISSGTCLANEITINWTGASAEAISANNAGSCTYGGDIKTPQSAETVPGKVFRGWRFERYVPQPGGVIFKHDLYVNCNTPNSQYPLSFQGLMTVGDNVTLPQACGVSDRYNLIGYVCDNGIGNIAPGETFTMPSADVICTAQWEQTYTVNYVCGSDPTTIETSWFSPGDAVVTLNTDICDVPYGYEASAWTCVTNTGHTAVHNGGSFFVMPADNVTCTVAWTPNQYTVTYDCSNGLGLTPTSNSFAYGQNVPLAPNTCTAPSGSVFAGWNCSGVNVVNNGTFIMPMSDVICTAQWEAM